MSFTFYPTFSLDDLRSYMPDVPVLLPASSWARNGLSTPNLPEHIRQRTTNKAADCGGFVATRIWGDYRYTPAEYVDWLGRWLPSWAATMDYCCESPITGGHADVVCARQEKTTAMAYHFWTTYRNVPWVWVPTLQGWDVSDYRTHARTLRPLLSEMQAAYGPDSEWRVGIGTLCARASVKEIDKVLRAVREELPEMPFHLWGVKLEALKSIDVTNVVSSDSAAWHGMWYEKRQLMTDAAHAAGVSRKKYVMTVQLPAYIAKVQGAIYRAPALSSHVDLAPIRALVHAFGWTLRVRLRARTEYVYVARRVGDKVIERYLLTLADLIALAPDDLREKVKMLGSGQSPTACPTLWDYVENGSSEEEAVRV